MKFSSFIAISLCCLCLVSSNKFLSSKKIKSEYSSEDDKIDSSVSDNTSVEITSSSSFAESSDPNGDSGTATSKEELKSSESDSSTDPSTAFIEKKYTESESTSTENSFSDPETSKNDTSSSSVSSSPSEDEKKITESSTTNSTAFIEESTSSPSDVSFSGSETNASSNGSFTPIARIKQEGISENSESSGSESSSLTN